MSQIFNHSQNSELYQAWMLNQCDYTCSAASCEAFYHIWICDKGLTEVFIILTSMNIWIRKCFISIHKKAWPTMYIICTNVYSLSYLFPYKLVNKSVNVIFESVFL